MMRLNVLCLFFLFLLSVSNISMGSTDYPGPVIEDFSLIDQRGQLVQLSRQITSKAVVFIIYASGCPIIRKTLPEIDQMKEKYAPMGIRFFLLDPNIQDNRESLIKEAKEYGINIPILIDDTQDVAKSLGVTRTAEAFVIDSKTRKVIYRGPINNRFNYERTKSNSTKNYLDTVLNQFLEGKPLDVDPDPSLGCAVTFENSPQVDYVNSIAPIIEKKCALCHRDLKINPTNFWSYNELRGWSQMMKEVIRTERMPPWEADPHFLPLQEEIALTTEEKKSIYAWIEKGQPELDPKIKPIKTKEKVGKKKSIRADLVFKNINPIVVGADSKTPWYYQKVISEASEDIWVDGSDIKFSNRSNIQHAALIIMKKSLDLTKNIFEPQYAQAEDIYSILRFRLIRNGPTFTDRNTAFLIPKGSHVYMELHFSLTGKEEVDDVEFVLQKVRSKTRPNEILYRPITVPNLLIPANAESISFSQKEIVKEDGYLLVAGAHMHWRGKSSKLLLIRPGAEPQILYSARYVFKNRTSFSFKERIPLKVGDILEAQFEFDNSIANPAKVDFTKTVSRGFDANSSEMATMHIIKINKLNNKNQKVSKKVK